MAFQFQYRQFAQALYHSLTEDAFYITIEDSVKNNGSAKEAMLRYMEFSMTEGKKYGELFIPRGHEHGVSIWSKPLTNELNLKKSKEKKNFLLNHMGNESLNIYADIVEFMSAKADPLIDKNFWYLSIVGILPNFQGQGLGNGLINKILEKTDQLNVPTYLETFTPRNMTFYNRLGYKAAESFDEPTTQGKYWLMIREPLTP